MGPICMYKSNLIIFRLLTGMTPTDKNAFRIYTTWG